jgi:hypothetical protein
VRAAAALLHTYIRPVANRGQNYLHTGAFKVITENRVERERERKTKGGGADGARRYFLIITARADKTCLNSSAGFAEKENIFHII